MSVVSTRWPAILYLGVLAACGSSSADDSTGPSELRVCQQPVAVRVVRTATLTVSWLPLCRVNQIVFHEPGPSFASPWLAYAPAPDSNPIAPPVQYGVLPAGTLQFIEPQPLTPGTMYFIDLSVTDSTAPNGLRPVGHDSLIF